MRKLKFRPVKGVSYDEPSMTVPSQSYTVRELFERAVLNSMPENVQRRFFYEDTNDIEVLFSRSGIDVSTLDLVELEEYKEQLSQRINDFKQRRKAQKTSPKAEDAESDADDSAS